jgi:hypothetical protein
MLVFPFWVPKALVSSIGLSHSCELKFSPVDQPEASPSMRKKGFLQHHFLRALCVALHVVLVLLHIAVLISTTKHWEHHFTFAVERQTAVSFWTTVITQGFGTV